jgi:hypothetical protein
MRKNKWRLKHCGRITALVMLLSFLMRFPAHGEPLTAQAPSSSEGGTRLYNDLEIDLLIEDLTAAAEEAIEKAAAEAAKAAAMAALEREGAALREAQKWRVEAEAAQRKTVKSAVLSGVICFLGGLVIGAGGVLIIGGR